MLSNTILQLYDTSKFVEYLLANYVN